MLESGAGSWRAANDRLTGCFVTGKKHYCCEADRFVNGVKTINLRQHLVSNPLVVRLTGL